MALAQTYLALKNVRIFAAYELRFHRVKGVAVAYVVRPPQLGIGHFKVRAYFLRAVLLRLRQQLSFGGEQGYLHGT